MSTGFDGSALAVFTTLAPTAMFAFACLGVYILVLGRKDSDRALNLSHWLLIPLAIAWLGFIASSTHLGMPSNALYVASGVGRSPLSNEVAAVVSFLFFSGVYWLYSFKQRYSKILSSVLLVAAIVTSLIAIAFSAMAYSISTVVTWDIWYVPASLMLDAAFSGPLLASLTLFLFDKGSREMQGESVWHISLFAFSLVAFVASIVVFAIQADYYSGLFNNITTFEAVFPNYIWVLCLHDVLCGAGLALQSFSTLRIKNRKVAIIVAIVGFVVMVLGILIIRFSFYDAYLSVGF